MCALGRCIGFRREAGRRPEHAKEMKPTHAGSRCEHGDIQRVVRFADKPARLRDSRRVTLGQRVFVRPASPARSKARRLGFGTARVKAYVLAPRETRRARGTAVHARRAHRVDEAAVRGRISPHNRSPSRIRIRAQRSSRSLHDRQSSASGPGRHSGYCS